MEHESARIGEVFNFGMLHLEWPTALFIFVVFILTVLVLNNLLFKPILKTLEGRQSEIDSNNKDIQKLLQTIAGTEESYNDKLMDVRNAIQQTRQQAVDEASAEAKQMIETTRSSVAVTLDKAEKELAEERANALKEAVSLTEALAKLIKTKVLA